MTTQLIALITRHITSLLDVLPEHLNAEIVAGTITSKQDAMDYMTWTYFFRRLVMNPTYYDLQDTHHDSINKYLSELVEKATQELQSCGCLHIEEVTRWNFQCFGLEIRRFILGNEKV